MSGPSHVRAVTAQMQTVDATIANGQSLSGAIDLGNNRLVGIQMPAAWTAAGLSFAVSVDGVTYQPMQDKTAEYTAAAVVAQYVMLPRADFIGIRYLKVRSGTVGSAVNQGAARTLKLAVQP